VFGGVLNEEEEEEVLFQDWVKDKSRNLLFREREKTGSDIRK
jgi:hypothetical protein